METEVLEKPKVKKEFKLPKLYKVILLNDDVTSADFVVEILKSIFNKSHAEAVELVIEIHEKGKGICGVYSFEIAETKKSAVITTARVNGFPLMAVLEET